MLRYFSPITGPRCPECSRMLRFPDFVTMAQDGGKVISLTHRLLLPPGTAPVLISVRFYVDPRIIVRSEGFYVNEKSNDTSWYRTSDLRIYYYCYLFSAVEFPHGDSGRWTESNKNRKETTQKEKHYTKQYKTQNTQNTQQKKKHKRNIKKKHKTSN